VTITASGSVQGLVISAGKMSAPWSGSPASIKLDDLDISAPSWGVDADHGGRQDAGTGCDCEVVEGDAEPVVSASVAMS